MSTSKNTVYNIVGALLPAALSLLTIPLYIGLIGEGRYGVMAIAWLLLDYFGLFDLGLGRATSQRIASLRDSTPAARSTSFWTAVYINLGFGLLGGLIAWPVATFIFGQSFSITDSLRAEMLSAIPWLILAVPLSTLSGVLTGALQGRQKFLELNIISTLGALLLQVAPLAIAYFHGPDLQLLLASAIASKVVTMLILFTRCREHVFRHQPRSASRSEASRLLKFGGWVTVSSLVGPLMSMVDRFAIGATLGAQHVTYYTVSFQLGQRAAVIPGAVASAALPRLSVASAKEASVLCIHATRSLAVVMTPVMVMGLLLIEPFLKWWLNPDIAQHSALTSKILIIGFWVNAFAFLPFVQLQASGRPDLVAKSHATELIPYLLLLYWGLHYFGLPGAAVAYTLRNVFDCLLMMHLTGNKKEHVKELSSPGLLMAIALCITLILQIGTLTWWVTAIGLAIVTALWCYKKMPVQMRAYLNKASRTLAR